MTTSTELRRIAIEADEANHSMREYLFNRFLRETVYQQAVDRWLTEVIENVWLGNV